MRLNKSAAHVLLHILNGHSTGANISEQMPTINLRSVQRSLLRLTELGVIIRDGTNNPTYSPHYPTLLKLEIADQLLEDKTRPISRFNHGLMAWLAAASLPELNAGFGDSSNQAALSESPRQMSIKELEYLTVELSWKSSALEGNSYTLLDTQLLLLQGIKAKHKTEFETQMILNHKQAIAFMAEHAELFAGSIAFATLEELHRMIGYNLGIASGVRKKLVRISASNYQPLSNPHQLRELRENADKVLAVINHANNNPFNRALLALALIPYLQIFEDGNKRTGRMLANAILIHSIGRGFSLRKTEAKRLALAYLSFYEFNSVGALSKILADELA